MLKTAILRTTKLKEREVFFNMMRNKRYEHMENGNGIGSIINLDKTTKITQIAQLDIKV